VVLLFGFVWPLCGGWSVVRFCLIIVVLIVFCGGMRFIWFLFLIVRVRLCSILVCRMMLLYGFRLSVCWCRSVIVRSAIWFVLSSLFILICLLG